VASIQAALKAYIARRKSLLFKVSSKDKEGKKKFFLIEKNIVGIYHDD